MVVLLMGFTIANFGARALLLRDVARPNPFAAYADLFPGQPASALETRAFSCPSHHNYFEAPSGLYCTFKPVDGAFSNIGIVILEGEIHEIVLTMRENIFTVGDFEMIFETRAVHKFPPVVYFSSPQTGSSATINTIGYTGQFPVFLLISKISFTGMALPTSQVPVSQRRQIMTPCPSP